LQFEVNSATFKLTIFVQYPNHPANLLSQSLIRYGLAALPSLIPVVFDSLLSLDFAVKSYIDSVKTCRHSTSTHAHVEKICAQRTQTQALNFAVTPAVIDPVKKRSKKKTANSSTHMWKSFVPVHNNKAYKNELAHGHVGIFRALYTEGQSKG
jgi:hypothetical protein